jgi:hypothetical protein
MLRQTAWLFLLCSAPALAQIGEVAGYIKGPDDICFSDGDSHSGSGCCELWAGSKCHRGPARGRAEI